MAQLQAEAAVDATVPTEDAPAELNTADQLYPDEQQAQPEGGDPEVEGEVEQAAQVEQDDVPAIDPPVSWKADAKEAFSQLPPELQRVVADREAERERFVQTKAQEAKQAAQTVEQQYQSQYAQALSAHAEQLQRYAQLIEPQQPDIRLLQTNNEEHRALYYQQDAAYRQWTAQREEAQREASEAAQQAEAYQHQLTQQEMMRENQVLAEKIPEWSDPSARTKLLSDLGSIGSELGYSQEQMAQARAVDIIGLKIAAEWKAKAAKYDALNKSKMVPVRAAKALPKVSQPGVAGTVQQPVDLAKAMYPND